MVQVKNNPGRRNFLKISSMAIAAPLFLRMSKLVSLASAKAAVAGDVYNRAMDRMVEGFRAAAKKAVGWGRVSSGGMPGMARSSTVTKDALINLASGYVTYNPFWVNESYAANTRWGGLIAFPDLEGLIPGTSNLTTDAYKSAECGFERQLWPGEDYEFLRPIRVGDTLRVWNREPKLIELGHPDFEGVRGVVNVECDCDYINQRAEVVSTYKNQTVRYWFPKGAPGTTFILNRYGFTKEEIVHLDRLARKEKVRGADIRYWEDVNVGDTTDTVVIGPTNIADIYASSGGGMPGGGPGGAGAQQDVLHKLLEKEGTIVSEYVYYEGSYYKGAGRHADDISARMEGEPGAFLWGRMSVHSMLACLTNWIGDDAFVRKFSWRHVYRTVNGDASYAMGKITRKYRQNDEYLVDIALWQQDMRGFIVDAALATVALLSRTEPYPPDVTREISY
ncbi:MAG: MaoC family dehydratase N-terminal domain-containing protein [Deltaproteobacteria bacterium]|nr:MaoC family dehydratase N-terminal domain-containing protein [Deltaproteobacteria bacterium]